jgi:hypothetical protein
MKVGGGGMFVVELGRDQGTGIRDQESRKSKVQSLLSDGFRLIRSFETIR